MPEISVTRLRKLEWSSMNDTAQGHERSLYVIACPVCGGFKCVGHKPKCWLAKILAKHDGGS